MANIKLTTTCVISVENFDNEPMRCYSLTRLIKQMVNTGSVSKVSIRRAMVNALLDATTPDQRSKVFKGKIITGRTYKAELMREKHATETG